MVIAVTYLFSAIAVVVLPWRKPDLWFASPASKIKLLGVPVVPVAGERVDWGLSPACVREHVHSHLLIVRNSQRSSPRRARPVLGLFSAARLGARAQSLPRGTGSRFGRSWQ